MALLQPRIHPLYSHQDRDGLDSATTNKETYFKSHHKQYHAHKFNFISWLFNLTYICPQLMMLFPDPALHARWREERHHAGASSRGTKIHNQVSQRVCVDGWNIVMGVCNIDACVRDSGLWSDKSGGASRVTMSESERVRERNSCAR